MQWLRTAFRELFGLFVEDGSLAVAILAWLGVVWLLLPRAGAFSQWSGPILFAGLACILAENTLRSARKSSRGSGE